MPPFTGRVPYQGLKHHNDDLDDVEENLPWNEMLPWQPVPNFMPDDDIDDNLLDPDFLAAVQSLVQMAQEAQEQGDSLIDHGQQDEIPNLSGPDPNDILEGLQGLMMQITGEMTPPLSITDGGPLGELLHVGVDQLSQAQPVEQVAETKFNKLIALTEEIVLFRMIDMSENGDEEKNND